MFRVQDPTRVKTSQGALSRHNGEQAGPSVDLRKDFSKAAAFPVLERGQ